MLRGLIPGRFPFTTMDCFYVSLVSVLHFPLLFAPRPRLFSRYSDFIVPFMFLPPSSRTLSLYCPEPRPDLKERDVIRDALPRVYSFLISLNLLLTSWCCVWSSTVSYTPTFLSGSHADYIPFDGPKQED
jgi:hypothetical protein